MSPARWRSWTALPGPGLPARRWGDICNICKRTDRACRSNRGRPVHKVNCPSAKISHMPDMYLVACCLCSSVQSIPISTTRTSPSVPFPVAPGARGQFLLAARAGFFCLFWDQGGRGRNNPASRAAACLRQPAAPFPAFCAAIRTTRILRSQASHFRALSGCPGRIHLLETPQISERPSISRATATRTPRQTGSKPARQWGLRKP